MVAQKTTGLSKTALRILDACHGNRDKGKFVGDCNALNVADLKGALSSNVAKMASAIDKKCQAHDPVRNNYKDGHHIAPGLAAEIQAEVEASGAALEDGPPLVGDKLRAKCRKAIGKARSGIANEVLKLGTRCQKAADKSAALLGALLGDCNAQPVKTGPRALQALSKACGSITDLSCQPFPGCVVNSATETGQVLLAAIYGESAVCGDGAVEGLETCDDGGPVDGDGCDSNCTITGCGNGITTAGEECDDGNLVSGDGCTSQCVQEFCGDGIVQTALGEECDDGNQSSGDSCEPNCRRPKTVSATITNDACNVGLLFDAASVTFTIHPATGTIGYQVDVHSPRFFFCWPENLVFLQGGRQIGVSSFQDPGAALLSVDNFADHCDTYQPGAHITGTIGHFPAGFDLAAPFTAHFDFTFCRDRNANYCGNCTLAVH